MSRDILTVADLIEALEEYPSDAPIRVAIQPSYPLAVRVANVVSAEEIADNEYDEDDEPREDAEPDRTVWIATSSGVSSDERPYGPRGAWDA